MRAFRTLFWVVITALLVSFVAMNWGKASVNVWPQEGGYLHFDWPVGLIAIIFFLLGLAPMWLLHKATRWSLRRKLDNAERALASALPKSAPPAPNLSPDPFPEPSQSEP